MANIDLHIHPFLQNNRIEDVIKAMEQAKLDIIAVENYNSSLYPEFVRKTLKAFPDSKIQNEGILLPNKKIIFNAGEYNTAEKIHILTVGYSILEPKESTEIREIIDTALDNHAFIVLDHPYVDNGKTKTAGHISEELEQELENLFKEYSGSLAIEWNGYCIPWVRYILKNILNTAGHKTRYYDVNQKAEQLAERLNLPLVADTDLHARYKRYLKLMGTSRIETNIVGEMPSDALESMKRNIFNKDYKNVKQYISFLHLLDAFCLPITFPWIYKNPRA